MSPKPNTSGGNRKQRRADQARRRKLAKQAADANLTAGQLKVQTLSAEMQALQSQLKLAFQLFNECEDLLSNHRRTFLDRLLRRPRNVTALGEGDTDLVAGVEDARAQLFEGIIDSRIELLNIGIDLLEHMDSLEDEKDEEPRVQLVQPNSPEASALLKGQA